MDKNSKQFQQWNNSLNSAVKDFGELNANAKNKTKFKRKSVLYNSLNLIDNLISKLI